MRGVGFAPLLTEILERPANPPGTLETGATCASYPNSTLRLSKTPQKGPRLVVCLRFGYRTLVKHAHTKEQDDNRWNFEATLKQKAIPFTRRSLSVLQINIGKICNQACQHCHVESTPYRTENMTRVTVDACLALARRANVQTVDITGGAPEMNPNFKFFVSELRKSGIHVLDRCNLTILFEPGQEETAQFLADQKVEIVASLPCYTEENVRRQRGNGVFDKSIRALQLLNTLGYGKEGSGLRLSLVYNPVGAFLPPEQSKLEADYKEKLRKDFGIEFNQLFTITNMPIKRFAEYLDREDLYAEYLDTLSKAFNPFSAENVMCRDLLSIGYDGKLYDCDFNQMLEIPLAADAGKTIFDLDLESLPESPIASGHHCFGCTAGSGSSCTGALG